MYHGSGKQIHDLRQSMEMTLCEFGTLYGVKHRMLYRWENNIVESKLAPDLVPYCLRHSFCTDLQDHGVPINVAKYLMGHADIQTTANIYTNTTEQVIDEAAKKINQKY